MKQFIKNNWWKILVIIILISGAYVLFFFKNTSKEINTSEVKKEFLEKDISSATEITCTYPLLLNTSYLNGEITHSLPKPETNPIIITFSKLTEDVGQMSSIDSTQTITTVPIIKISEDNEKVIYIEKSNNNYLSTYTIYKKLGVSVYTKTVSLMGIPSGSLSTGSCVGY